MHTQQVLLGAIFPSPRGIANTMSFKQKSFIPQVKAEKKRYLLQKREMHKSEDTLFCLTY